VDCVTYITLKAKLISFIQGADVGHIAGIFFQGILKNMSEKYLIKKAVANF
jgi:thiamine transporter ThiT